MKNIDIQKSGIPAIKAGFAALTVLGLAGCASTGSIDTSNGGTANARYQEYMRQNKDSCLTENKKSFDLGLIRFGSTNYDLDDGCVEQRIAAIALRASTSINDPVAQADMAAFGLMLAGLGNERINKAVDTVANGLSETQRSDFLTRIAEFKAELRQEGAAAATAENREAIEHFNQTNIEIVIPKECNVSDYNDIKREFQAAYSYNVRINNTDYSQSQVGPCNLRAAWIQGTKAGGGSIPTFPIADSIYPTPVHSVAGFANVLSTGFKPEYAANIETRMHRAELRLQMQAEYRNKKGPRVGG